MSPALVPFIEGTVGREKYDQRIDSTGSERSSTTLGARAGAEVNFGEKLSGELAAGYVLRNLDDANLADISGLTLDGDLTWSPLRGTNVNLGLATTLESATTAGQSGAVGYELSRSATTWWPGSAPPPDTGIMIRAAGAAINAATAPLQA